MECLTRPSRGFTPKATAGWLEWRTCTATLCTRAPSRTRLTPSPCYLLDSFRHAVADTRPTTLSCTALKSLAQLLLARGRPHLTDPHGVQWSGQVFVLKLDIHKAFDSVAQARLGEYIFRRVAVLERMPCKARLLVSTGTMRELLIQTNGGIVAVKQSNGVRQGSPDSPVLFSRLMGEAIGPILATIEDTPHSIPCSGSICMDDTYLWAESLEFLQKQVEKVETALAKQKTLHQWGENRMRLERNSGGQKAGIIIRPAALWGCSTWPCHVALLQAANAMQLRILRDSGNYGQCQGETWAEWSQRTLRQCRLCLHKAKHGRWSTFILGQTWQLPGHIARG